MTGQSATSFRVTHVRIFGRTFEFRPAASGYTERAFGITGDSSSFSRAHRAPLDGLAQINVWGSSSNEGVPSSLARSSRGLSRLSCGRALRGSTSVAEEALSAWEVRYAGLRQSHPGDRPTPHSRRLSHCHRSFAGRSGTAHQRSRQTC